MSWWWFAAGFGTGGAVVLGGYLILEAWWTRRERRRRRTLMFIAPGIYADPRVVTNLKQAGPPLYAPRPARIRITRRLQLRTKGR